MTQQRFVQGLGLARTRYGDSGPGKEAGFSSCEVERVQTTSRQTGRDSIMRRRSVSRPAQADGFPRLGAATGRLNKDFQDSGLSSRVLARLGIDTAAPRVRSRLCW